MIREGQNVSYVGEFDVRQDIGALGRVLSVSGDAVHVRWTTGPKTGQVDLTDIEDLLPADVDWFADSLDFPTPFDEGDLDESVDLDLDTYVGIDPMVQMDEALVERALDDLVATLMSDPTIVSEAARLDPADVPAGVLRIAGALIRRTQD